MNSFLKEKLWTFSSANKSLIEYLLTVYVLPRKGLTFSINGVLGKIVCNEFSTSCSGCSLLFLNFLWTSCFNVTSGWIVHGKSMCVYVHTCFPQYCPVIKGVLFWIHYSNNNKNIVIGSQVATSETLVEEVLHTMQFFWIAGIYTHTSVWFFRIYFSVNLICRRLSIITITFERNALVRIEIQKI